MAKNQQLKTRPPTYKVSAIPLYTAESTGLEYVEAKVRKFQKRFKNLKKDTHQSLTKQNIPIDKIVECLRSISADDVDEHNFFSESQLEVFDQATNPSMLLGQLDYNMDYFSYHLLDCLITEFDLKEVKVSMESYKLDLEQFRMKTELTVFAQKQMRKRMKMPHFEEVVVKFDSEVNVNKLEKFRQDYVTHYTLKDYSLFFAEIQPYISTFQCFWFILNHFLRS